MSHPAELDVYRCGLDGINLIEASAGTGKTWNICGLYLRLLLEHGLDVQHILVVTFTNAATAELRERIRARIVETLDCLADPRRVSGDPFVPNLIGELQDRAGLSRIDMTRSLDLALQTFDEAAIFTIHGFCQRALADTPFAAGMPLSMELLQDDTALLMQAVHDFWRRHIAGEALPAALAACLQANKDSPETLARLLKRHLGKPLAKALWPEEIDLAAMPDECELQAAYAAARATWRSQSDEIVALLVSSLPALKANSYKEAAIQTAGQSCDALFRGDDPLAPLGDKISLLSRAILENRTKKGFETPSHAFFEQLDRFLAQRAAVDAGLVMARLRLIRLLLKEASDTLRESKRNQRQVSFDDMLSNLHERLTSDEYPWLAESLRVRFPAALIDEFQDTDPLQFDIFRTIYGGGACPLFLVGDPKQAIYSFRNADLHTYLRAKRQAAREYSLVANQRSSRGLISALNALFETNAQAFMLPGLDYLEVGFGDKPRRPFLDRSETRADLQVWMMHHASSDAPAKKEARKAAISATAGEIARLINEADAGRVELGGRPLRPGDIAVLVRSHGQGAEMKRSLAELNIGSVELSQTSVFQTPDAEEVERILLAILEPGRERLLRAALATGFLGCDAAEIEAISNDEARLMERLVQFNELRALWLERGFGIMYRRLMTSEHVAERLLAGPDGERRLTNFLHLGECLHQASEASESPEALVRYLETRRRDGSADEAAQMRLESDQNLVQIVTIHKSKGLEYPVVFCPFLWDGRSRFGGAALEGDEYHDDEGRPVIDWRKPLMAPDDQRSIQDRIRLEQAAEHLRLIYVALTRAVYRCYLVAGCYSTIAFGNPSQSESARSMLNWLVAGQGMSPEQWFDGKRTAEDITAAWQALGRNPHVAIGPMPGDKGKPVADTLPGPESLVAEMPPSRIPGGWRISSYSGLSHGAVSELAASDHDARVRASALPVPSGVDPGDILRFPRGAEAGHCIHAVFERIDFMASGTWPGAVEAALDAYPQRLAGVPEASQRPLLSGMLMQMVGDVTATPLVDGLQLKSVAPGRRLAELEFSLPAAHLTAQDLNQALKDSGYRGPQLAFHRLDGYLKGFIDLVFEHDGRYYVLDWKSNHLGYAREDYTGAPMAEAMAEHGYHLQYLIYAVALDRYLSRRVPGYDYASHFGGVLYLFVRGVRPHWLDAAGRATGVYFHRPDPGVLRRLNQLLMPSRPAAELPNA